MLTNIAELRALKRAQEILGRLHDVQVLLDRIRQLQASLPRCRRVRRLDVMIALENECRRLHARFMHQKMPWVCHRARRYVARWPHAS